MLGLSDFLLAGVLPGLVAMAVRHAALRARLGDRFAWPLAVAIGFAAGQIGLEAQGGATSLADWLAKLPAAASLVIDPRVASHWLPAGAAWAAVVAVLAWGGRVGKVFAALLGVGLAVAIPTRLLWGSVYLMSEWTRGYAIGVVALLAGELAAIGWLVTREPNPEPSEERAPSGALRAGLTVAVALGLAVVLATSGSLSYARLAGVVVASLAGGVLGGVGIRKPARFGDGVSAAGPVVTTLIGGLILLGFFYAEVTTLNASLLTVALAAAGAVRGWSPAVGWRAVALRTAICLAPLGLAVSVSAIEFNRAIAAEPVNPYADWSPQ